MAVHGYEATANGAICANGLFYDFPRRPFFSKVFIFSRVCFYVGMYIVCTFIQILGRDVVVFLMLGSLAMMEYCVAKSEQGPLSLHQTVCTHYYEFAVRAYCLFYCYVA